MFLSDSGTPILLESKSDKTRELFDLIFIPSDLYLHVFIEGIEIWKSFAHIVFIR